MDLATWFQLGETLAVVVAVVFGIAQVRQYHESQDRDAALELLRSFQTPDFAKALHLVYGLEEGLTGAEIERRIGEDFHYVYALMTTWESVGVLVFRGQLDLELVDDFFSGPITVSWRKLKGHVLDERRKLGRDTVEEWFQWLAERFAERESDNDPVPAQIAQRDWEPPTRRRWW